MYNCGLGESPLFILLRRLPLTTTPEDLRTMLLFAADLVDTEVVQLDSEEDSSFTAAVAQFSSSKGASEAQAMLDGKVNTAGEANMVVELVSNTTVASLLRRSNVNSVGGRKAAHSISPTLLSSQKSSRFNNTFQSMDMVSPPMIGSPPDQDSAQLHALFSPTSGHSMLGQDRPRNSVKSVIGEDGADDDDTGELLKDPVAYMKHDNMAAQSMARKNLNARIPTANFAQLSLNTTVNGGNMPAYASPRGAMPSAAVSSPFSPPVASSPGYSSPAHHYIRHNYPPVNPADQNPPCNTLYVGNLPIDTSEDELKAMFSKQRGYKRLCFRTKQNGPMCFVEFEDISFATKALSDLYGAQLHNSVRGGIRLSFSKNPLGVRSGQVGSTNPSTPISANGSMHMNGVNGVTPNGYSAINGPPPGLAMPPGYSVPGQAGSPLVTSPIGGSLSNGQYPNQGLGIGGSMPGMRGTTINSTSSAPSMGPYYTDYMIGR